jgi:CheY-specific phosphatase CheX
MATGTVDKSAFKVEYMQPFIDSLKGLFESHLGHTLSVGKLTLNPSGKPAYEVSGVIAFTGTVIGRAVFSLPWEVAEPVVKDYLNMPDVPPELVEDAIGELSNVVVGRAKGDLDRHNIVISPPTVVRGTDYTICPQRGAVCLAIPCHCQYGPMRLDISIIRNDVMGMKL